MFRYVQTLQPTLDVFRAVADGLHNPQAQAACLDRLNGAVELVPAAIVQHDAHKAHCQAFREAGRVAMDLFEGDVQVGVVGGLHKARLAAQGGGPDRPVCIPEPTKEDICTAAR